MAQFLNNLTLFKKTLFIVVIIVFISVLITGINTLRKVYMPNVIIKGSSNGYLYIKTGSSIEDVCRSLYEKNYIVNRQSFEWMAEKKKYTNHIKAGKFKLRDRMSNNDLIDLLRSGKHKRARSSKKIRLFCQDSHRRTQGCSNTGCERGSRFYSRLREIKVTFQGYADVGIC